MYDVVIVTLEGGCGPRVPVLELRDAFTAAGARAETVDVGSDAEIDELVARFDGPPRADGLLWPDPDPKARLIVATTADGQVRAVVRRLIRRYAPPPRHRPADLPADRTVPDLPPIGILSMPGGSPATLAAAILAGRTRRLDLLRTDSGSVTLDGALLAAGDGTAWYGRVEVDDALLSDGTDPILACVVANGSSYSTVDGLPMVTNPNPADGVVQVAVALPVVTRSLFHRRVRVEVRRTQGRAVSVTPRGDVPLLDDGVADTLDRKRSWWIERNAWAVYAT